MQDISYTLIRSKRRTVALHVSNGSVEVRAPLRMSQKDIDDFVFSREKWINKHLEPSKQRARNRENFSLNYGDTVFFLNEPFVIIEKDGMFCPIGDEVIYIPSGMTPEQIKHICVEQYRLIALGHLIPRTQELATQMSVMPNDIWVGNAKSRWGSCSADKRIRYSWRLIMADEDIVDYVIVHELAHLIEMNHSKRFWAIVERYLPDYKDRRKRLRELQVRLANENWD